MLHRLAKALNLAPFLSVPLQPLLHQATLRRKRELVLGDIAKPYMGQRLER